MLHKLSNITNSKEENKIKTELSNMLKSGELDNLKILIQYYRECNNYNIKKFLEDILNMKREEINYALQLEKEYINEDELMYHSISILEIINGC